MQHLSTGPIGFWRADTDRTSNIHPARLPPLASALGISSGAARLGNEHELLLCSSSSLMAKILTLVITIQIMFPASYLRACVCELFFAKGSKLKWIFWAGNLARQSLLKGLDFSFGD